MNNQKIDLEKLFHSLIINAISLSDASTLLLQTDNKHIALGLSELALEELGKAFTCLAYLSREFKIEEIQNDWRNHNVKAHRAFLFEFFSTKRLELVEKPNYFPSKRSKIFKEKEISFYVDYNINNGEIHMPNEGVGNKEIVNRASSVYGPLLAAAQIHDCISNENNDYKKAFSEWAYFVMTNNIYQQEALEKLESMKKDSSTDYSRAIDEIIKNFSAREGVN